MGVCKKRATFYSQIVGSFLLPSGKGTHGVDKVPGYYDWTVNPSAMVDAPRGCAIRGAWP